MLKPKDLENISVSHYLFYYSIYHGTHPTTSDLHWRANNTATFYNVGTLQQMLPNTGWSMAYKHKAKQ